MIDVTGGFREFRNAETSCAERILARQIGVAGQTPLFRQVSFLSRSRKMDRRTSLANRRAISEGYQRRFARQIE
jgi:hypothetical protein